MTASNFHLGESFWAGMLEIGVFWGREETWQKLPVSLFTVGNCLQAKKCKDHRILYYVHGCHLVVLWTLGCMVSMLMVYWLLFSVVKWSVFAHLNAVLIKEFHPGTSGHIRNTSCLLIHVVLCANYQGFFQISSEKLSWKTLLWCCC